MTAMYRWQIEVMEYNGNKVEAYPGSILAATKYEVTEKVRALWGATYNEWDKKWNVGWSFISVSEVGDES